MGLIHGPLNPGLAAAPLNAMLRRMLTPEGTPPVNFRAPPGAPALIGPDSVSWRIFKNPVALFIGGAAAVILELGEPRVRAGVWDHSSFRSAPSHRLARTGLAAMVTVYGPRETAQRMIAGVNRMHTRVSGVTGAGAPYSAVDPDLLDWVQATASFGFITAYHVYARALSAAERDRAYAEAKPAADLYGARGAPDSEAALDAMFACFAPALAPSDTLTEFLALMRTAPILPAPLRPLQRLMVRGAVNITPRWARERLGLGAGWDLSPAQRSLLTQLGKQADRLVLTAHPAVQACRRLGLPDGHLYR